MTADHRAGPAATYVAWGHAALFGAMALACYVSPETVFGTSAWLPLPRLAVLLFAAALIACAIVLAGSARAGSSRQIRLALLAAVVLDAQVPVLAFSQPASLEHLEHDLGIPWFIVPALFAVIVAFTVPLLRQRPTNAGAGTPQQQADRT
jgi:hypothetical protein